MIEPMQVKSLKEAKKDLKECWIPGEGYSDEGINMFVTYKDGHCESFSSWTKNKPMPLTGIKQIEYFDGSTCYSTNPAYAKLHNYTIGIAIDE